MVADKGSDKKTQEIAEKIAGGMFHVLQADKPAAEQATSGEVPVFTFSLDQHNAEDRSDSMPKCWAIWDLSKACQESETRRLYQRTEW